MSLENAILVQQGKVVGNQGTSSLNGLSDVSITSPSAGQALVYDTTTSSWINGNVAGGGGSLDSLSDVSITSPSTGQILVYDTTSSSWINSDVNVDAEDISYNNTTSGLTAINVQEAVDEVDSNVDAIVNVYGAKNMMPNKAATQMINDVTFTVNNDGTITATGTATDDIVFTVDTLVYSGGGYTTEYYEIYGKTVTLSGTPAGGSDSTYCMAMYRYNNNGDSVYETGSGATFTYTKTDNISASYIIIQIRSGYELPAGGLVFKPMIRDARITDSTYVPYAMTNREITEKFHNITISTTDLTPGTSTLASGDLYAVYEV